jgi:hypothetical protein
MQSVTHPVRSVAEYGRVAAQDLNIFAWRRSTMICDGWGDEMLCDSSVADSFELTFILDLSYVRSGSVLMVCRNIVTY